MPTVAARRMARILPLVAALALTLGAAGSAAAATPVYPHTSLGNQGVNVAAVQYLLRHHGASIAVSGVFDAGTASAVKAFQTAHGLTASGHVGQDTWRALRVPVRLGDSGDAVVAIQRLLNEKRRTKLELTGVFGPRTRELVLEFQAHAKLATTGEADAVTWRALLAHFELPTWGTWLCDYSVGNGPANWGTANAIGQLQAAAVTVSKAGHGRVALGDIGFEHGGDIPGHMTHEHGLDVDLRPMRHAEDQCTWGTNWRYSTYDRAATRALVKAIRAAAPGHVKLIYFNDPVLVAEGLTTTYAGHDDHLHVRYCERAHPVTMYDC